MTVSEEDDPPTDSMPMSVLLDDGAFVQSAKTWLKIIKQNWIGAPTIYLSFVHKFCWRGRNSYRIRVTRQLNFICVEITRGTARIHMCIAIATRKPMILLILIII